MDPRLQHAAETGSISDFYALVDENPYILDNINAVPFVNTPFHVAAASGNIPFSTEMLNLKPSFATKLNTSGYSPLHLAVEKDHRQFITWLLGIDPELSRVKGREGITPFHLIVVRGDENLVVECLMSCPECIQDVTVNGHNALHLALTNGRFETLQVLTGWIQRMSQRYSASTESDILNKKDVSHNTPLHLAAYKEDNQAVKLLLACQLVKPNEVNDDGLTFLDILRHQGQSRDLELEQAVFKTRCKEATSLPKLGKATSDHFKTPITFWSYCSTGIKRLKSDTSEEGRAVFLIICTLIITSTYQTALQPPGGLRQSEEGGSAVMKQTFFIVLWVSNTIGFCCALLYTFCLLPVSSLFTTWFFWIGASLGVSYALAMAVISPHPVLFICAAFALYLLFPLYLFMEIFIALRLSHLKATVTRMFVTFIETETIKSLKTVLSET
ncbi:ankyrin repeat-containing protein BDA1 [Brassica napus]|uniref:ankyrin repeat-containing protein BDA1 n=1 Tax=Brassica napus TaxID=3708 RepID=UPI00207858DA|nr:ankyrin repeat-containing protein BDA1 [Brassica napus]